MPELKYTVIPESRKKMNNTLQTVYVVIYRYGRDSLIKGVASYLEGVVNIINADIVKVSKEDDAYVENFALNIMEESAYYVAVATNLNSLREVSLYFNSESKLAYSHYNWDNKRIWISKENEKLIRAKADKMLCLLRI